MPTTTELKFRPVHRSRYLTVLLTVVVTFTTLSVGWVAAASPSVGIEHIAQSTTTDSAAGQFMPLSPVRVVDTRGGNKLTAAGTSTFIIRGRGGVPTTNVSAVSLTVASVNPSATTYLVLWPADHAMPNTGNVNAFAGHTTSNVVQQDGNKIESINTQLAQEKTAHDNHPDQIYVRRVNGKR